MTVKWFLSEFGRLILRKLGVLAAFLGWSRGAFVLVYVANRKPHADRPDRTDSEW